jgi:ATP-binding cassette subfamily B protein
MSRADERERDMRDDERGDGTRPAEDPRELTLPERTRAQGIRVARAIKRAALRTPEPERERSVDELVPPPPPGIDAGPPHGRPFEEEEGLVSPELQGAWSVLRRGLRQSPELRVGFVYTVLLALALTVGRLLVPILIQQIFDRGLRGPAGFRPAFVYSACAIVLGIIGLVYVGGRLMYKRLVRASEEALYRLRVRAFAHIHELSIAAQTEEKRGAFVSRVTADVDTLGQFMQWGALAWFTSPILMLGAFVAMLAYSWQLALVVLLVVAPILLVLRVMQRGMVRAYDRVRTRVGEMLSEISESIMGAAVVRAYGLEDRTNRKVKEAIRRRYRAEIYANRFQASIFPMADLFGGLALAAVVVVGAGFGPEWGLSLGRLVAFLFLAGLFLDPLAELSETFDFTQTAIAGWRKILSVLDIPVDVVEPKPGIRLPRGALSVRADGVEFGYRDGGGLALRGIDLDLRMVPQDGFLWDVSIRENVRFGREDATDADIEQAFRELGLDSWVASFPEGLDTRVGERGENLSVGERQLVALVRAQLAGPGLLILDEATSAVDPETERVLAEALERLSEGRTTVTIAHRLSTAESADFVLVFDRGRVVERGTHAELVAAGGVYSSLYESWLGNTRVAESA